MTQDTSSENRPLEILFKLANPIVKTVLASPLLGLLDKGLIMMGLGYPPIFENLDLGLQSLRHLTKLDFQTACFGHGKAITKDVSAHLRLKWGQS